MQNITALTTTMTNRLLLASGALLLLAGCGRDETTTTPDTVLDYSFRTDIRAETLVQIPNEIVAPMDNNGAEQHTIASVADLNAFNQALPSARLQLSDLDTYAYFLIRFLGCPYRDDLTST